jgi:hypothetical protein
MRALPVLSSPRSLRRLPPGAPEDDGTGKRRAGQDGAVPTRACREVKEGRRRSARCALAAAAALGLLASLRLLSPSAAGDADQLEPLSPPPQGPSLLFCFFPLSLFAATVGGRSGMMRSWP